MGTALVTPSQGWHRQPCQSVVCVPVSEVGPNFQEISHTAPRYHVASGPKLPGLGLRFATCFLLKLGTWLPGLSPQSGNNLAKDNWPIQCPVLFTYCAKCPPGGPHWHCSGHEWNLREDKGARVSLCPRRVWVWELKGTQKLGSCKSRARGRNG